jgi:hypothetical protein
MGFASPSKKNAKILLDNIGYRFVMKDIVVTKGGYRFDQKFICQNKD